ncbi:L,D-transpeptidase family protein [uncultured Roseovarius sp.]|uniref:L,D-transpeptidase family protein n=1 Tax=uncultured Roseovarius sp. TaxID=293344 RepID=UPI00262E09F6|nr:L,D-transpeptidase family protein [uncultured Roseovarius sp.]
MRIVKYLALVVLVAGLSACSSSSKFKKYDGPEVTHVIVHKGDRRMFLLHNGTVLKSYDIELGFAPKGHKQFEGDGKTPEGTYRIDRRNPNSDFHLSIGLSYPNIRDIAKAQAVGKSPGGDIFIHGQPNKKSGTGPDWTAGCISVENGEMEDIYAMVKDGTLITVRP